MKRASFCHGLLVLWKTLEFSLIGGLQPGHSCILCCFLLVVLLHQSSFFIVSLGFLNLSISFLLGLSICFLNLGHLQTLSLLDLLEILILVVFRLRILLDLDVNTELM